jgi:hypothetical protein
MYNQKLLPNERPRMAKTQTLTEVVQKAKLKHANRYTYLGFGITGKDKRRTLRIVCPDHGEFTQSLLVHNQGAGCTACSYEARAEARRTTLESAIEKSQAVHGVRYTYRKLSFNGAGKAEIHYTCSEHGDVIQSLQDHVDGHRCKPCGYATLEVNNLTRFEFYKARAVQTHGDTYTYGKPLEIDGVGFFSITCQSHGDFTQRFVNHSAGEGCPKCGSAKAGLTRRYDPVEYRAKALKAHKGLYSYDNLVYSETSDTRTKIEAYCYKHGPFLSSAKDHLTKLTGCPSCCPRVSKEQQRLYDLLNNHGANVLLEQALDSSKKRWDIVCHKRKLAIEYDGLLWHSSKYKEANGQVVKFRQAISAGYRQINIFEDEWLKKPQAVERLLLNSLGLSKEAKIFARKCRYIKLTAKEAKPILEQFHLQGFRASSAYVGLVDPQGVTVAVLGYELRASGRGRLRDDTQLEITRYTTICQVSGGFSRCLKSLLREQTKVAICYTFSDNRLYTGEMYKVCGFTPVAKIPHDYNYIKSSDRYNKANFKKSLAYRWASVYDETLTEKQLAELNGFYQIYDCGKTKWQLTVQADK